jgi:hypothetical protein
MMVNLGFGDSFSGVHNLLALLSTSNIYYTALPKGFFLFKATKEGALIIVGLHEHNNTHQGKQ